MVEHTCAPTSPEEPAAMHAATPNAHVSHQSRRTRGGRLSWLAVSVVLMVHTLAPWGASGAGRCLVAFGWPS